MAVLTEHHLRIGDRDVMLLEGPAGWGECSPFAGYPCDPAAARRAAEEAATEGWPTPVRSEVPVNALVSGYGFDPAALAEFSVVKVKMATPDDVRLVEAVRDVVGNTVRLRVDANGAWDVDTAVLVIERLAPLGIELVEQPVATLEELALLRRKVAMPLGADECIRSIGDARRLHKLAAADAVILKVQPLGGVRAALAVAEAAEVPAIPTSMMETSVGLAAGLALAAALPDLPYACGLATAGMLAGDVTSEPLVPEHGVLRVRAITPDPELLARYAVSSQETSS
ncbi:MAG: O-succinylbenzoate synthase [Acidimicrobiia bacterium]|nr:O-succinylbenzoate synthase [Acidimicrobiia bacterium]